MDFEEICKQKILNSSLFRSNSSKLLDPNFDIKGFICEVLKVVNQHLKLGAAKLLVDTEDVLMYELKELYNFLDAESIALNLAYTYRLASEQDGKEAVDFFSIFFFRV
jgi:hypothetical protein